MEKLAGALAGIRHYVALKRRHKLQAYANTTNPSEFDRGWYAGYLSALDSMEIELDRRQDCVWNGQS